MFKKRRLNAQRKRRGTIYAIVLLSSLIVATVGLSSLQLIRLQSRTATGNTDFIAARSHARAALEIGMLKVRNDPFWRRKLGNGNWLTNQTIGGGKFTLSAVDPIDNDVTKGDNHPVILTGIGMQGTSAFKASARLEIGPRVGSCLEVSLLSGNDTSVTAATLTSDHSVSANNKINCGAGSTVNADVDAYGSIEGSGYTKATVQSPAPQDMPDPSSALSYYLANGTVIPYTALPTWSQIEIVRNTNFATSASDWIPKTNCVLERTSAQAQSGTYSLRVRNRVLSSDVAAQDLTLAAITKGNKYRLSYPILPTANGTARGVLTLESSGDGVQTFMTPTFTLAKNGSGLYTWVDLKGDITLSWTGTLTKATLSIWISTNNDYYMDTISLTDITYPSNQYVIDRQLISPSVNPYGAVNSKGIYVLNCSDKDIVIGQSRIVGTLVFINPGSNTAIQDTVVWEAAIDNFPALLTDDKLTIKITGGGVSEASVGRNLNPPGTPYPFIGGVANATATDTYPSKITGLIYSADDLDFSGGAEHYRRGGGRS